MNNHEKRNIEFRKAYLSEIDEIYKLYIDRVKWFKDNNIRQWSKYLINHPKEEFECSIKNGWYYILKINNKIVAGLELSTDSKLWNDNSDIAYYIYKLNTKVGYNNLAQIIFSECKKIAIENNKKYLRLDHITSNVKLSNIYESHGFKLKKQGKIDGYNYTLREFEVNQSEHNV